jgi:hypothetical protein
MLASEYASCLIQRLWMSYHSTQIYAHNVRTTTVNAPSHDANHDQKRFMRHTPIKQSFTLIGVPCQLSRKSVSNRPVKSKKPLPYAMTAKIARLTDLTPKIECDIPGRRQALKILLMLGIQSENCS